MPSYGPELVVPNVSFDGPAFIEYVFTGENDDGGAAYAPAEAITSGDYAYSFECLAHDGGTPLHVRICGAVDSDSDGRLRGATSPGQFSGTISVDDTADQSILLSVTGTPTVARVRNLSVRRITG
jgi:hypothetical protein